MRSSVTTIQIQWSYECMCVCARTVSDSVRRQTNRSNRTNGTNQRYRPSRRSQRYKTMSSVPLEPYQWYLNRRRYRQLGVKEGGERGIRRLLSVVKLNKYSNFLFNISMISLKWSIQPSQRFRRRMLTSILKRIPIEDPKLSTASIPVFKSPSLPLRR